MVNDAKVSTSNPPLAPAYKLEGAPYDYGFVCISGTCLGITGGSVGAISYHLIFLNCGLTGDRLTSPPAPLTEYVI